MWWPFSLVGSLLWIRSRPWAVRCFKKVSQDISRCCTDPALKQKGRFNNVHSWCICLWSWEQERCLSHINSKYFLRYCFCNPIFLRLCVKMKFVLESEDMLLYTKSNQLISCTMPLTCLLLGVRWRKTFNLTFRPWPILIHPDPSWSILIHPDPSWSILFPLWLDKKKVILPLLPQAIFPHEIIFNQPATEFWTTFGRHPDGDCLTGSFLLAGHSTPRMVTQPQAAPMVAPLVPQADTGASKRRVF